MSQYFFHLRDGNDVVLDDDGRELDDLATVCKAALFEARAIIAHEARAGCVDLDQRIEVENVDGGLVHRLVFSDAITIIGLVH